MGRPNLCFRVIIAVTLAIAFVIWCFKPNDPSKAAAPMGSLDSLDAEEFKQHHEQLKQIKALEDMVKLKLKNNEVPKKRTFSSSSGFNSSTALFLDADANPFKRHPYFKLTSPLKLHDYMKYLSSKKQCVNKPVVISMARVKSPLYWQLIENFFYTMLKYDMINCAVMVCISEEECMRRCKDFSFPCYDFQPSIPSDNVMHQIAEIKLLHISKALEVGVNIMILDLDVAFLESPMRLLEGFFENPFEQVRTQTDIGHVQEWRPKFKGTPLYGTWFTTPRANFGLYLVKAHPLSIKSFKCGWKNYLKVDQTRQKLVAIDQNALVGCIKFQRYMNKYNFSIFSLGFLLDVDPLPRLPQKVLLLDKIEHRKEWNGIAFELGGEIARRELADTVAIHATCYEGYTKLLVLKAANAFYSAPYYSPNRLTLTKPLMYITRRALMEELRALAFLAVHSGRTLLLPNILIGVGTQDTTTMMKRAKSCVGDGAFKRTCALVREAYASGIKGDVNMAPLYDNEHYWPSFRTVAETLEPLEIVEPAYYHKVEKDYGRHAPPPYILRFDLRVLNAGNSQPLQLLLEDINKAKTHERIVIDLFDSSSSEQTVPVNLQSWVLDSASSWSRDNDGGLLPGRVDSFKYLLLPARDPDAPRHPAVESLNICKSFLDYVTTNRTCFDKC